MGTYEEQYEKLINYKNEIIVKKPKKSSYSFDNEKYYIKFLNTDFELLKQTYAVTDHKYNTILQQKNKIEKQLQANQKMFLSSRSNFNDDLMRNLYKKYEIVINELNKIKEETNLFILMKNLSHHRVCDGIKINILMPKIIIPRLFTYFVITFTLI